MNNIEAAKYTIALTDFVTALPKELEPQDPQMFKVASITFLTTAVVMRLVGETLDMGLSEELVEHLNAKAATWIKKRRAEQTESN